MSHAATPVYGLPRLLTVDETAAFLRIDRSSVYRLEREGELQSVRVGRRRRFRPEDLSAYLERSSEPGP
jgi:excisionase family DNA binding protein